MSGVNCGGKLGKWFKWIDFWSAETNPVWYSYMCYLFFLYKMFIFSSELIHWCGHLGAWWAYLTYFLSFEIRKKQTLFIPRRGHLQHYRFTAFVAELTNCWIIKDFHDAPGVKLWFGVIFCTTFWHLGKELWISEKPSSLWDLVTSSGQAADCNPSPHPSLMIIHGGLDNSHMILHLTK